MMLVSSSMDSSRQLAPRPGQLFHTSILRRKAHQAAGGDCREIEADDEHCQIPSTSYQKYMSSGTSPSCSSCNEMNGNCIYMGPINQGSSRDAIGLIWPRDNFEIIEHLGEGFFGNVFKVRSVMDAPQIPRVLVMKVAKLLNEDSEKSRLSAKRSVAREAGVLLKLQHPNILAFCGLCVDRTDYHWSIHLLVDFCDRGSLHQLIMATDTDFPWLQRCLIAMDVSNAMKYVNAKGFMHRDLTSMNILLQSVPNLPFPKAVVADFGLSATIPKPTDPPQQVGTQDYMSPEMLYEKPYNERSDVFSFGVIACQMIVRVDSDLDADLFRTRTFGINYERLAERCPADTPLGFLSLAFSCSRYDPNSRPSFESIFETCSQLVAEDVRRWTLIVGQQGLSGHEGEVRFGRSHSDAALRASSSLSNGSALSSCISTPLTIPEGIQVDDVTFTNSQCEERHKLALKFMAEEPQLDSKHNFHNDGRIRASCRKVKPSESFSKRRFATATRVSKSPLAKKFVRPFIDRASRLLRFRKRSLCRVRSLPSLIDDSATAPEDLELSLPMDSTSDRLKKISMNYALGIGLQSANSEEVVGDVIPFRMLPRRHTVMQGFELSASDVSHSKRTSEDSTAPVSCAGGSSMGSFDSPSTSFDATSYWESAPHECHTSAHVPMQCDTIVRNASPMPAKRRFCSFGKYPEDFDDAALDRFDPTGCHIL